jgi:methionine-rich copper-binding protein CopC
MMRSIAVLGLLPAIWLAAATAAHAHAQLDHATPAVGSTVRAPPARVSLSFTEKLEPKFSSLEVRNAGGARVDSGGASVTGASMSVGLKPLPAGTYTVRWHVLSVDTHKTEGSFTFTVGP